MISLNTLTDIEIFGLLKSGDHAAYKEIYNRYYAALYIHAFKRLQEREECRDIVQELFTNLWVKREEIEISGQLAGYLYMAVRNRIFDLLSRKKLRSNYVSSIQEFAIDYQNATDHRVRQNQLTEIIDREIQALPPRTREIFELSRKGHFTHKQIAEQLNLSEQTVKSTVNNALKILRVKLGMLFMLI